jgi:putative multicomponent Na+:H+ antiporter subunit B
MDDGILYTIVALLPPTAAMLVLQGNPYHALVVRGIMGAVAAAVFAVLGAADVALTEAMVGTMLTITLYAVAVHSSLVVRLGVVRVAAGESEDAPFQQAIAAVRRAAGKHHLRLELVTFPDRPALEQALSDHTIHAFCVPAALEDEPSACRATTRIQRLYEIMRAELSHSMAVALVAGASGQGEPQ